MRVVIGYQCTHYNGHVSEDPWNLATVFSLEEAVDEAHVDKQAFGVKSRFRPIYAEEL